MKYDLMKARARSRDWIAASKLVSRPILSRERELMKTKWFAYRFLSPFAATKEFAECYIKAMRLRSEVREVDGSIRYTSGFNIVRLGGRCTGTTQMWIARQNADQFCMPYELYLKFTIDFVLARGAGRKRALPSANQLYFCEKTEIAWNAKFEEFLENHRTGGSFLLPDLPQYRIEHFAGLTAQLDMRRFILEKTRKGLGNLDTAIDEFARRMRYLPEEDFKPLFGIEAFDRAISSLESGNDPNRNADAPFVELDGTDIWISCLGLPGVDPETTPGCLGCPFSKACQIVGREVVARLKESTGSEEPIRDLERKQVRDRQRRLRQKPPTEAALVSKASA